MLPCLFRIDLAGLSFFSKYKSVAFDPVIGGKTFYRKLLIINKRFPVQRSFDI